MPGPATERIILEAFKPGTEPRSSTPSRETGAEGLYWGRLGGRVIRRAENRVSPPSHGGPLLGLKRPDRDRLFASAQRLGSAGVEASQQGVRVGR